MLWPKRNRRPNRSRPADSHANRRNRRLNFETLEARQLLTAATPTGAEFKVNTYTTGAQNHTDVASDAAGDYVVVWESPEDGGSGAAGTYGIYAQRYSAGGAVAGSEFRVNTYTTGAQSRPAVAMDSSGDFVVAWQSTGQESGGIDTGIYAQRYNAAGVKQGTEFRVNTFTTSYQSRASVAIDSGGDFVIAWQSYAQQAATGYGVYAQRYASTGSALGSEFRVNTYTSGQTRASVAMDSFGDFVVTWQSYNQDATNTYGIYAQRYNSGGGKLGSEFKVNTYTTGHQIVPSVGMDAVGDFVIAWEEGNGEDGSLPGIYAQRYNAAGAVQGSEFRVNTYTTNGQDSAAVAMNAAGDFVIAWDGAGGLETGTSLGVFAQRYNGAGVAQGTQFQLNTYTTGVQDLPSVAIDAQGDFVAAWRSYGQDGGDYGVYARQYLISVNSYTTGIQATPKVATDAAGDYVLVWQSYGQDGSLYGIYAQRYASTGSALGSEFRVNTFTSNKQYDASVAMDAAGDFVIAWESQGQDGGGYGVFAQRYNAAGTVTVSEFQVNSYTTNNQRLPSVAMDSAGDFVIAWQSLNQDGSGLGIYAQRFNTGGAKQGSEFQVNTYTTGVQNAPSAAMDAAGDFVIAWQSQGQDGSGYGIFAQRYNANGAVLGSEFRVNTYTTSNQGAFITASSLAIGPSVAMDAGGDFVVTWTSNAQDGSLYGIYAQRYASTGSVQGSEFRVNTYTTAFQFQPAAAMDAAGDFVIAWTSIGQNALGYGIYAQRYNAAGTAQGSEFQVTNVNTSAQQLLPTVAMDASGDFVIAWEALNGQDGSVYGIFAKQYAAASLSVNTYTTGNQESVKVATDVAGDYVVVWEGQYEDGSLLGIFAQRYNATGVAQGSEFRVNTYTTQNQAAPSVAMDAVGDFVIAWQSMGQDGSLYGVYAQRYNASGATQGSEFRVNTYTTSSQGVPTAAMDAIGDFVIAWTSYQDGGAQFGDPYGIYAQRYNATGAVQGSEFRVNTITTGFQGSASAAMDSAGDFVIAWQSLLQVGGSYEVYTQRYNSAGVAQGSQFQVNSYTTGTQDLPSVAMDSVGDFVIAWESAGQDGSLYGIYAQRYNAAGAVQGSEFRVNTYTVDKQRGPVVGLDAAGDFAIAWESYGQDGSNYGIYAQLYTLTGATQGSEFRVNSYTKNRQQLPATAMDAAGDFVVAWESYGQDGSLNGVYAQRYASSFVPPGTLVINGTATTNLINITFTDATHFTITGNGPDANYVTTTTAKVIYNAPNGVFSQVIVSDQFNNYTATQSFISTDIKTTGWEFVENLVHYLYVYVNPTSTSTATVAVGTGAGSNFFVGAYSSGYSYIADPVALLYSELSGFNQESVTGAGGSTYAYIYSTSHGAAVGNPGGNSTYTLGGVTSNLGSFPQIYLIGAADGTDTVTLNSAGGTLVGTPNFDYVGGTISGASFLIGAVYAANVTGVAAGATDTAVFTSYAGNVFNGAPASSALSGNTTNVAAATVPFVLTASGYHLLSVFESGAGSDSANLTSPGGGSFFGTSTASILTVGSSTITVNTYFVSGGQNVPIASTIVVTGKHDGTDQAVINDSAGTNALVAGGTQAVLTTAIGSVTINKFGSVTANKGNGSSNTVHMASAIDFVLTATGWATV